MNHSGSNAYNRTALHFDAGVLPPLLKAHLPHGPLALGDFGCGDGPLFSILDRAGYIGPSKPVYAIDLQPQRLNRVKSRFPYITTQCAPADDVPIGDGALDFVISTMVMEHVLDERKYLNEIRRVLRPGGRAFITTVYKKRWAWYFRKRDGECVLDTSHIREYSDIGLFNTLLMENNRFAELRALEIEPLCFPLIDPVLFRLAAYFPQLARPDLTKVLRKVRIRIPGYFSLNVVISR